MDQLKEQIRQTIYDTNGTGPYAFYTSLIFFFLYLILQLIDVNSFVKTFDILEVSKTSRTTIVFSYMIAYFYMFVKLILQLLTIVIIMTLIVWVFIAMKSMIGGGDSSGNGGGVRKATSAAEFLGGQANSLQDKFIGAILEIFKWILGAVFLNNFMLIFFIIIPILFLFFLICYVQFYDRKIIIEKDYGKEQLISTTNHNFLMMVMTTMCVFGLLTLTIDYSFEIMNKIHTTVKL